MITFKDLCEYFYSTRGVIYNESASYPYLQGRLIRIFESNNTGVRLYLGDLSFEQFCLGFDDLCKIIALGKELLQISDSYKETEGYVVRSLQFCNFMVVRDLYENKNSELYKLELKSTFTIFQLYAMLALEEVVRANRELGVVSANLSEKDSMVSMIEMISSLCSAQEILAHIYSELYHKTVMTAVDSLASHINRDKQRKSEGGKYSRLSGAKDYFIKSAKAIWTSEEIENKLITTVGGMYELLSKEWSAANVRDKNDKQIVVPRDTAIKWFNAAKIVPKEASKPGPKK